MEASNQPHKGTERRSRSNSIAQHLTDERTEMLVQFCRVAGVDPWEDPHSKEEVIGLLQEFCEILVDYLAAGHFGLYQRFIDGEERRESIRQLAEQLYPQIAETTQLALDFNDKYEKDVAETIDQGFADDLSQLGQALAVRIELEDKLLNAMH